tara:strand:+ start:229 stop:1017 length:789 start_codon:yes stop_codon:yes gene_type:complete
MNRQLYWCDVCYKELVNEEEEMEKIFFSCYTTQQFCKHLKTTKHIANKNKVEKDPQSIKCKYCSKSFSWEGYETHEARNKELWKFKNLGSYKDVKCNNFSNKHKRYESFKDYQVGTDPNKPIQKRTKVGKYSPVTESVRPPNKNKKSLLDYVEESNEDTEEQDKLDVEAIKLKMTKELRVFNDDTKKWEYNANPDYDENIKMRIIKNEDALSGDELDYTERPQFEEVCDDCGLPINYEVPIKILDRWEIDSCCCEETDSDED